MHLGYEDVEQYPIQFEKGGWEPDGEIAPREWFRLENRRMQHPKVNKEKDTSRIVYNSNIIVAGIPEEAYDYVVNGKSAIEWVMSRQGVSTHKDSGIVNDANDFAIETMGDPAYPLRLLAKVITVSLETIRIVDTLREIEFS